MEKLDAGHSWGLEGYKGWLLFVNLSLTRAVRKQKFQEVKSDSIVKFKQALTQYFWSC